MQRKGQAAMEFLMTYGWAILAAIIAIGVLAYFGVFSSDSLAGSSAILNNPLYAETWAVTSANGVQIEIVNNGGDTINVTGFTVTGTGSSSTLDCTNSTLATDGMSVSAGSLALLMAAETCTLTSGDNYAGDLSVTYLKSGSSLTQTVTGSVRAPIQ